VSTNNNITNS